MDRNDYESIQGGLAPQIYLRVDFGVEFEHHWKIFVRSVSCGVGGVRGTVGSLEDIRNPETPLEDFCEVSQFRVVPCRR